MTREKEPRQQRFLRVKLSYAHVDKINEVTNIAELNEGNLMELYFLMTLFFERSVCLCGGGHEEILAKKGAAHGSKADEHLSSVTLHSESLFTAKFCSRNAGAVRSTGTTDPGRAQSRTALNPCDTTQSGHLWPRVSASRPPVGVLA